VRVDVYAAAVVLWELLTCRMLFDGEHESAVVHAVMYGEVIGPRALRPELSQALDEIVLRALSRDPEARFASVREMARAVERVLVPASQSEVSEWLDAFVGEQLRARAEWLRELQRAVERAPNSAATRVLVEPGRGEEGQPPSGEGEKRRSRPESHTRRKQRSWLPLVALAGVGAAAAIALLWPRSEAGREPDEPTVAPAHAPAPPSPTPAADDWDDDPARAIEARPIADPTQREEPSSTADAGEIEREPTPARAGTRPARAHQDGAPASDKGKARGCREPYVIDALGVKRWKRECL
jgi:serine/threonine-protein kinase